MKTYSLLTDDSNYEENFNFDYDKYIKQIDALFESKVYKEFQMYEFREGLINFYVESSKYISENIMHLPKDSLLLYLTEEEEKKETKSEDKGIAKFFKDAGAWLANAWKTIIEAFKRKFNIDKATDKAKSLEEKAKKYDELKKSKEELEAKLKTLESSVNSDSEVSGVETPIQQPPQASAPAPAADSGSVKPVAAAPVQPLTAKQKSLNIIAQYSNWAKMMYDRCDEQKYSKTSISIPDEINNKITDLKNKCSDAVDTFLMSKLYKMIEDNSPIKNNFNTILNIINLYKTKEINLADSSVGLEINSVLSTFNEKIINAKKLVRDEAGEYGDSTINKLVENELRGINNKNKLDEYAKVYGNMYKPIIKYLLIMISIYVVIYFGYISVVENTTIVNYKDGKKMIQAYIAYINLLYINLVLNTNFISKYYKVIKLTDECIDTAYMRFGQITIMELAVSYILIKNYMDDPKTKDALNQFFNPSNGTVVQIHNLMRKASFPPENPISNIILTKYISENYANGNGLTDENLEKALSETINKINELWEKISALSGINYNSLINSVVDFCTKSFNIVTDGVGKFGKGIMGFFGFGTK